MGAAYQIQDQYATYFITPTIVDWVDIFLRKVYRDIVVDSLNYCIREKGLIIYGYVIMTNHMHLIVRSEHGKLSDTLGDMKKFTASQIIKIIRNQPESRREWLLHRFEWNAAINTRNSQNQVWIQDNHAVHIHTYEFFISKLTYLHNNPIRAGWVEHPEDYTYSSAKSLSEGTEGLIKVTPWGF